MISLLANVGVDGGLDYLRRGFTHSRDDFTELSILEDAENSI
jgi:hypothetical protein